MPKHSLPLHRYHNLWKLSPENKDSPLYKPQDEIDQHIDKLCLRADLCENYESYIYVLGEGMIELLNKGATKRRLLKHPYLYDKIMQLGEVILDKSYFESDQFYLGLFVSLRIKSNWLKVAFYQLMLSMLHQVLDQGLKITDYLKEKIIAQLKQENVSLFYQFYGKQHSSGAF